MATKKYLDNTGLAYFWGKIKSYIASLLGSKADDSDVVHLAGAETVTGAKTFSGAVKAPRFDGAVSLYNLDARNTENLAGSVPNGFFPLFDVSRSCKSAFLPASSITIEYSIDGGSTWIDYGASDNDRRKLFSMAGGYSFALGKGSSGGTSSMTTDCKLRVTATSADRYARVETLYVYLSTMGHAMAVDIEASTIGSPTTFRNIRSNVSVSGFAGPNVISLGSLTFGGYSNQTSQNYAFRFTFYCTAIGKNINSYPWVNDIRIYGSVAWIAPNNMMKYDHLYSWDFNQNAVFPASVTAAEFSGALTGNVTGNCSGSSGSCTGNSATATKFASAQSVALTGDVTGSASSQAGWSIATTLANSGVTAGRYTSVNVDAKGRVTAGNVKHSYTTAANAAKNWYRIANANTSQIDTTKPLHVQFMLTAYNTTVNNDYYQRWFVDCEVFGRQSGIRLFGNSAIPFSQIRVLYENTDASVTASNRPAIDIYLNYVITSSTSIKIEEINNSGFDFLVDGVLTASTAPTGFESRAVGVYGSGINNCGTADYATYHYLYGYNISANTTLSSSNSNHRYRILNCTGTITLTVPSWNSSSGWFFIKNNGTGIVTVHPASTSVMFDNVSADVTLQPGEYIRLACQSNNHYSIIDDGRWKTQCIHLPTNVSNPERTVLCADGVWRDISQIAFPIQ